jgi:single-strand DNA-binding protein
MSAFTMSFVGNLGRDPEMRYLPTGDAVTKFRIAVKLGYGENKTTLWVSCSSWGKQAEFVAQYLKSGDSAFVSGELAPDKDTGGPRIWIGSDGKPRADYELRCDKVEIVHRKDGADRGAAATTARPKTVASNEPEYEDDEIPF